MCVCVCVCVCVSVFVAFPLWSTVCFAIVSLIFFFCNMNAISVGRVSSP